MSQHELIEAIHASKLYGSFAMAGGSRAIAELLEIPGASGTVAEVIVPYATQSMAEFLKGAPEQACAPDTARALAMAAFQRTLSLAPAAGEAHLFGLGCTTALRTTNPKRGDHRAYVAIQTEQATRTWSLILTRDARSRDQEEHVVAKLVLTAIASIAEVVPPHIDLLTDEVIEQSLQVGEPSWRRLITGAASTVCTGAEPTAGDAPRIVFPGAFNPVHDGHERMAHYAEQLLGGRTEFEICVRNVDKPPLNYEDIHARTALFPANRTVWLTSTATFEEKAQAFPGTVFIVGLDTIVRIANPRYYGNSSDERDAAIRRIADAKCRFLTFGRHMDGAFRTLADVELPAALLSICDPVPESEFRVDLSSSAIRASLTEG